MTDEPKIESLKPYTVASAQPGYFVAHPQPSRPEGSKERYTSFSYEPIVAWAIPTEAHGKRYRHHQPIPITLMGLTDKAEAIRQPDGKIIFVSMTTITDESGALRLLNGDDEW